MFFAVGFTKYGGTIIAGKGYDTEEECFEHFEESLRSFRAPTVGIDFDGFGIVQVVARIAQIAPPQYARIALVDATAETVEG